MAVIIKNMDMPKVCEQCRFYDTDHDYPMCLVNLHSKGYKFNGFEKRMDDCPLSDCATE